MLCSCAKRRGQSDYLDGDILVLTIRLAVFAALIALTAFFVASEFAIVKVRKTRIDQLAAEGNKKALKAQKLVSNLDEYLSACQLGITMTALGLGWIGEPTFAIILEPLFDFLNLDARITSVLSFLIVFSLVTFSHVVIGELAPKTIAIQKAEKLTLTLAGPLILFHNIMYPFIKLLNGSARALTGLFGFKAVSENDAAHTEEELRMILADSYKGGEINNSEYKYVNSIFEFSERLAKETMVPRTEIVGLEKELTIKEVFELMGVEQYTRYPIIDGDKDNIIGLVNMKHILTAYIKNPNNGDKPITAYMQPIIRVMETMPISELLLKIQRERIHMAILIDEYGGTSGLVTIEDIIEEIVGDIRDEFDADEVPEVRKLGANHYILDAKVIVENVNDLLGITIEDDDVDTIGGWFMTNHFNALEGDTIEEQGYAFTAKELDGHHILYVEVKKLPPAEEESPVMID
ncbi:hemolysin family protein [Lysinibacillus alkalisoli]|uniref:hemolysin family protein n=1 Tax=Lysinibacillus alkalisoli TaxID=1911548 RepID=UPI00166DCAEE|nr:hemolysin family protein [Lysinibacillus alkalisoli]